MAGIGLSRPRIAVYNESNGIVTYTNGALLGKFTELSISLNEGSTNILNGDNGPAESDNQFSGGTSGFTTTELEPDNFVRVFGVKEEPIGNGSAENAKWYVWDDDQSIPYLGAGGVIKRKVNGDIKWQAFILTKLEFRNPSITATTQGETISWQTQQITANILRADDAKHRWFMLSSFMNSEDEADAIVKAYLMME